MPNKFEVNTRYNGTDTTIKVERTTDTFPLDYTVNLPGDENQQAKIRFYGNISGPYDDPSTASSEAYFIENPTPDPEFEESIAKAIIEHEKEAYPTLVPEL